LWFRYMRMVYNFIGEYVMGNSDHFVFPDGALRRSGKKRVAR
jgi:hypothetical protein